MKQKTIINNINITVVLGHSKSLSKPNLKTNDAESRWEEYFVVKWRGEQETRRIGCGRVGGVPKVGVLKEQKAEQIGGN